MEQRSPPKKVTAIKRLIWAKLDVRSALELAEHLHANYDELQKGWAFRAIQTGIVVSYSRPFGENENLGTLSSTFRNFDDPGTQHVHDGILRARDILEAHTNFRELPSFVKSASGNPADSLQVEIEIDTAGLIFWSIAPPFLEKDHIGHVIHVCQIQEKRLDVALQVALKAMAGPGPRKPGVYHLGVDFL